MTSPSMQSLALKRLRRQQARRDRRVRQIELDAAARETRLVEVERQVRERPVEP